MFCDAVNLRCCFSRSMIFSMAGEFIGIAGSQSNVNFFGELCFPIPSTAVDCETGSCLVNGPIVVYPEIGLSEIETGRLLIVFRMDSSCFSKTSHLLWALSSWFSSSKEYKILVDKWRYCNDCFDSSYIRQDYIK